MATLNVCQFREVEDTRGQRVPLVSGSDVTSANVTFTTSTQSSAFAATTSVVRLVADAACYVKFAADPTAAAGDVYLPANSVEYFSVPPGLDYKVAVVTA